jgi:hypothetical protein
MLKQLINAALAQELALSRRPTVGERGCSSRERGPRCRGERERGRQGGPLRELLSEFLWLRRCEWDLVYRIWCPLPAALSPSLPLAGCPPALLAAVPLEGEGEEAEAEKLAEVLGIDTSQTVEEVAAEIERVSGAGRVPLHLPLSVTCLPAPCTYLNACCFFFFSLRACVFSRL